MSLKNFIDWLFKEHTPLKNIYGDSATALGNTIGSIEITLAFFIIGIVFIILSPKNIQEPARKERVRVAKLIGWALIACAIARGMEVLSIWHNYGNLNAIIKNITGIIGLAIVVYIPYLLGVLKRQSSIEEVKAVITETHKKVEELKDLTKKIDTQK